MNKSPLLTCERFCNIIKHLQKQQEKDDILTDILVCKDSTGWINSCEEIEQDIVHVLELIFKDKESELISSWLYDLRKENEPMTIYHEIDEKHEKVYELNTSEDLYNYLTENYNKLLSRVQVKPKRDKYKTINMTSEELEQQLKNAIKNWGHDWVYNEDEQ